jgi:phospholipase C
MSVQDRIEHVFVLMLENRSYDHIFGFPNVGDLAGDEGNVWSGQNFKMSAGADLAMPSDPAHGFIDVVQQLCGVAATYPPNGPYSKIDMSGQAHREMGKGRPSRGRSTLSLKLFRSR